jgi:hypothetical protein
VVGIEARHDGSMAPMGDEARLREYAERLADAVDAALPAWVVRSVERLVLAWQGSDPIDPDVLADARAAGEQARVVAGAAVRSLLRTDIDSQAETPLGIIRRAVSYPTDVLRSAGVPPVQRDAFAERAFPDDIYGLTPAAFADVDPSLHEPGLEWGAAKAHVHLARRRAEGLR